MAEIGCKFGCMRNDLPTLNDFRMVESIARNKTIRAAAQELAVTPPVLSRQLGLLEAKLGFTVFDRDTRNLTITRRGKKFIQGAAKILEATEEAMNDFNSHLEANKGRLKIAAMPSLTGLLLPRLLSEFTKKHPEIDLVIEDYPSSGVDNAVMNESVDLGFTDGSETLPEQLSFIPLFMDDCIAISSRAHSPLKKKEHSLEELVELPIISAKKGNSYRKLLEMACARRNLEFAPHIECTHLASAVALAAEGHGILIFPTITLPVFNSKLVRVHRIKDFKLPRKIGISYPSGKTMSPAANKFIKQAKKEAKPIYNALVKNMAN